MSRYPVQVRADHDPPPGRWLWLVKWLLLIPHYVVLVALWVAFVALTFVAYVAVLFTGRYPRAIHDFNVGVLRWSWRAGYYGYQMLGTDRYPPFALAELPDYPAGLHIERPYRVRRWLPLVAWLLALPHLLIVAALAGGARRVYDQGQLVASVPAGLVTVCVLIVAAALLFTGRYPAGLHDLLAGVNRWALRLVAYVALLTDAYPPFRLDQGAREPDDTGPTDGPAAGSAAGPAADPAADPAVETMPEPPVLAGHGQAVPR